MTPKEKANELVDRYSELGVGHQTSLLLPKQCALIAVDELIYETQFEVPNIRQRYWQDVKNHIQKL